MVFTGVIFVLDLFCKNAVSKIKVERYLSGDWEGEKTVKGCSVSQFR